MDNPEALATFGMTHGEYKSKQESEQRDDLGWNSNTDSQKPED